MSSATEASFITVEPITSDSSAIDIAVSIERVFHALSSLVNTWSARLSHVAEALAPKEAEIALGLIVKTISPERTIKS